MKDIFLALIFTGMRYSDYEELLPEECSNDVIGRVAINAKVCFKIPIHPRIAHIIKNHPNMAAAVFNRCVKDFGK